MPGHIPVLLPDVLRTFNLKPGQNVIDATLGAGGHAVSMLDRIAPDGRLLGIEADPRTLIETRERLASYGTRVTLVQGNFRNIKQLATAEEFARVDAVLFDLGLSSLTVDDAARGFSFQRTGPLDMRFDPEHKTTTAADLINHESVSDLAKMFREYGDERAAEKIAAAIVDRRQNQLFSVTTDLADVVALVSPRRGKIHPATKVFQALRIAVNDELGAIQEALPQAAQLVRPGGTIGVISFHSLEHKIVKLWMREMVRGGQAKSALKKVHPTFAERQANPRARSAIFRAITII